MFRVFEMDFTAIYSRYRAVVASTVSGIVSPEKQLNSVHDIDRGGVAKCAGLAYETSRVQDQKWSRPVTNVSL